MTAAAAQPQSSDSAHRWESEQPLKHLSQRTASKDAQFMLDVLRPGMNLLDCGCGPGTITLGLAPLVAPGEIRGIDINATLIDKAQAAATQQGITNVKFEVGDAQALPFDDDMFDLVFSHALLEHLPKPLDGLAEMKRVLRPGGMIAIRTPDWGGNRLYPDVDDLHRRFLNFHERMFMYGQSDPYRGRHLGKMLVDLGFEELSLTASYTCYGTRANVTEIAGLMSDFILKPSTVDTIVENGWGRQEEVEQVKGDLQAWAQMPGAFHMRAWIEAVARKP